ncbi:DUF1236 domain-containing protein [Prosthecomicrobium sp. N25]|uniref:DUF1236 domain-containing protein n=1 Tax=Prosthecomicrobium sp. N25 TaxID=3129254 RepID=UPI0030788ED7
MTKRFVLAAVALAALGSAASAQSVILSDDDDVVIRRVIREPAPRVVLRERVTIGATLPDTVELSDFPDEARSRTTVREYRYVRDADDRIVVVEPQSRKVIKVIER